RERTERYQTEWILLTSGTTGRPKMVVHTLASLSGAMRGGRSPGDPAVWSTFYDIRRYGGLQIFLRALLGGGSMVLSSAQESTEAGVAFDVGDGLAGFPASLIGRQNADVEMKVEDGSLRIRSARTASRYLGHEDGPLADRDGFVDTGDMLERRGDRYHFVGRR